MKTHFFFHGKVLISTCAGGAGPNLISVLFPKKFMLGPYLSVLRKVKGVIMAAGGWKAEAGCSVLLEVLSMTFNLIFII